MLDLADCTLQGAALTPAFLRDGIAHVVDMPVPAAAAPRAGLAALAQSLGYRRPRRQPAVATREGLEDGGWMLPAATGSLRAWMLPAGTDLDAPVRLSPTRAAQRILLAVGEPAGLLTNGTTLRLLLCDPARADSFVGMPAPVEGDRLRLLRGLVGADRLARLPAVLEAARLHQTRVTTDLRRQAREAIIGFINALPDRAGLDALVLWRETLILVYRLLFILKLEMPAEPGAGFSFASTQLWRTALSPNLALGALVRRHLDRGHDTGSMLESGLRTLFRLCRDGLSCAALEIAPLGGALFGAPLRLNRLVWGERAVAILLDRLIWIPASRGERVRVHYGSLDVEDLGSVYEALLEQEPGIAAEPLRRKRHGKFDAIVPAGDALADIPAGAFFLRAGVGRKASGSFYTPREFVRFLVRAALDPKIAALSPDDDPRPAALLTLTIVDPATGSGHFLVEACRHLAEALLTACRQCDERGLLDRLPDPVIAPYLPSRGYAEARARAICRRLVAVHCLYGCDRNELAVELAKLSLWLESYAEGLPLTFLDHRLVQGDALTGPFFDSLATLPVTGGPLDPLLARGVTDRLQATLALARQLVASLNGSIGRDMADLALKQVAKDRLDSVLRPLRQLARAWAGATMRRDRDGDDAWLALAQHVTQTGAWPSRLTPRQMSLMAAGSLPWDLQFPEIFPAGFSVVLGNPPWDVVLPNTKDFVADYDPDVLDAPTRAARARIEQAVLARPGVAAAFATYREAHDRLKRIVPRLYQHQSAGNLDLFRLFAERNLQIAAADGAIAVMLPSAFHANEGCTELRRLYFEQTDLAWCLSFENRRRVFAIDSRFKFDLVVAFRPGPSRAPRCGFYLERIEDVADAAKIMQYSPTFLERTGGANLTLLELRGAADLRIAERLFGGTERLGPWCEERGLRLGRDLHMTDDAGLFLPVAAGGLPVHEGKTFHQYTDQWVARPRYSVAPEALRPTIARASAYPRLAFRDIARSNDERTMIAFMAPADVVFGHTATVEKTPWARDPDDAFLLCALFNTFVFDWLVRQKAATHLSLYLLDGVPVPSFSEAMRVFLAAAARQLTYGPDPDLRARVDAAVARAYGLDRDGFAHILASFNHRSDQATPARCLAAFDASACTSRSRASTLAI